MPKAFDLRLLLRSMLVVAVAFPSIALAEQAPYADIPNIGEHPSGLFIRAETFDTGGEGIAYHDSTPENEPGAYRAEGVDIEHSEVGDYDVGWVTPGEWLEYTVNVVTAGAYMVDVRYAADGYGGSMHVEFGGIDKTGPIELPDTGGWQTWKIVSRQVQLDTGIQVMRLAFDTGSPDGWLANIDGLDIFEQRAYLQGALRIIEAEHYDRGGEGNAYHDTTPENEPGAFRTDEGVDVEETWDEGGGYDVGWVRAGEWLEYTAAYPPEPHSIAIRYASDGFGGIMHVEAGGVDATGPIELRDTGGWQTWNTIFVRGVELGGRRPFRLSFDTPGADGWLANINWFAKIVGPAPTWSNVPEMTKRAIEAEYYDFGGPQIGYYDTTPENEPGAFRVDEGVDVEVTSDVGGGYDVGWITPGEWLLYTVIVTDPGYYTAEIRYAADGYGGSMHLEFERVKKETIRTGPIELPDTGGWQTWQTLTVPNIYLPEEGRRLLRLVFDTGNADGWLANINWIRFTKTGP